MRQWVEEEHPRDKIGQFTEKEYRQNLSYSEILQKSVQKDDEQVNVITKNSKQEKEEIISKQSLRNKEKGIIFLVSKDEKAKHAFNKMLSYYEIYDEFHGSIHSQLIKNIYINENESVVWKLANDVYISESSCYRYRRQYARCFDFCLAKESPKGVS